MPLFEQIQGNINQICVIDLSEKLGVFMNDGRLVKDQFYLTYKPLLNLPQIPYIINLNSVYHSIFKNKKKVNSHP